jgi:hypothetical protein
MKESRDMKRRTIGALRSIKQYPAYDKHDLQSSIVDLLADLLHLVDKKGLSITDIYMVAYANYKAEGGMQ